MSNQGSILLRSSSVRQVQYSGSGMYMFQPHPGHKPLTLKQKQEKDDAFKKRLQEAERRLAAEEGMGGDAA
ncbi:hypothetical protein [Domibacillus enclensis]|uniref:Uncharacterized protein n=1 Tax=Domibacillus enclensis TaxID=1017273 RepID=A0A1N6WG85_9BACI|nr:hypothetical protein [Domibacillus enclensis]OXS77925.1 hypothetical protein B1B05_09980 [Domibacillus enclensis]SIQ89035.1 hypothetical protein SAMN05443094_104154 [Domibacillus enclensis]